MTVKSNEQKRKDFIEKAGIAVGAAAIGAAVGAAAVASTDPAIKQKIGTGIQNLKSKVEKGRDALADKVDKAKKQAAK